MATQTPVMHQNHHNSNSYTHRPHAQSSSSMGAGAGTAGLYDDPTAWHSPSPFATTPSSLPHVSLGSVGTGAGTSVSPVESKHKSRIGAQSTSPEIIKKAHGQALGLTQTHDINGSRVILTSSSSSPSEYGIGLGSGNRNNNLKGKEARLGGGSSLKEGSDQVLLGLSSNGDEKDYQTGSSSSATGGPMMKIHPPPDPRYPYANLLQPVPLDLPSSITPQSATFPTQLATYFPDSSVLDTDAFTTESRAHPTKADILKRHSISRSYWDDPSPETTNNATPPSVTGTTMAEVKNDASGSNSNAATPTGQPKASGRSGQKRRQKYTRTRTGCLCCRARRIKCDEGRPTCKRCMIAKKECQYPDPGEGVKEKSGKSRKHDSGSRSSSEASDQSDDDATRVTKRQRPTSKDRRSASPSRRNAAGQTSPDDQAPGASGIDYGWDASFIGGPESSDLIAGSSSSLGDSVSSTLLAAGAGTGEAAYDLAGQIENKDWGAAQGGAPMLTTPNFLLPWFPTAEERSLILHYCANAASLMMAIPSGLNPMLAINLPLALDSPRGLNPSADALRVALLGIGAIHQAFLLARSGVATAQTAAMFQYASTLRDTGKEMVRRAVRDGNGALTDAALGAGTALATIDIFFGGSGWMDNFALAKEMVALRGGPAEMLKRSEPKKLTDGVTVSPARLMLEILAIYETFSCLTTAQEPSLISDMWESWWLEGSRSTYEEHSVEKQFGMSRVMVLLFTRVTRLLARVSRSNAIITESGPASNPISSPETTLNASVAAGGQSDDPLVREARQLNRDVDAWIESLQLSTLEHERVQVGNRAYAYAMKILLLRMVFRYPRDDIRVQNAAQQVLQHCSWSTAALGMSIDLTWPAIIAGACMDGASRQWVLTLLEGFKSQCCFDIETAGRILSETWRRADTNADRSDWREVCDDLGLKVLLC